MHTTKHFLQLSVFQTFTIITLLVCLGTPFAMAKETPDNETYLKAKASFYVIDLPDYLPLWKRIGLSDGDRLSTFDEPVVAPMTEIIMGKQLDTGLFVEARGRFSYTEPVQTDDFKAQGRYNKIGYFPASGFASGESASGTSGTAYTKTELQFLQLGGELLIGFDCQAWEQNIELFGGYWGMKLDQKYSLDYQSSTGDRMSMVDNVDTTYNGLLIGGRTDKDFGPLSLSVETTHGIGYASATHTSLFSNPSLDGDTVSSKGHGIAYRATLEGTLSTNLLKELGIGLTGGLQYLSYVPQMVGSGEAEALGSPYGPASPAHIRGRDSVAGSLGLKLSYSF
ncbi:MAG: hypothetical protein CL942_02775 [Desulfovibrio sp.]|nr:hypothetical protein [Desulfovibrio sp.]